MLQNEPGPARDIVTLNAGAAIYAANITESLTDGYAKAKQVLDNGDALAKFEAFIALTQRLATIR
ncbi:hypothetical protein TI03_07450 [Achromatium sp. WMS1]|nr:hypothetical protein TI03_07450 [Achromatium sp. WMS1]